MGVNGRGLETLAPVFLIPAWIANPAPIPELSEARWFS
jgi:hypothetical protein